MLTHSLARLLAFTKHAPPSLLVAGRRFAASFQHNSTLPFPFPLPLALSLSLLCCSKTLSLLFSWAGNNSELEMFVRVLKESVEKTQKMPVIVWLLLRVGCERMHTHPNKLSCVYKYMYGCVWLSKNCWIIANSGGAHKRYAQPHILHIQTKSYIFTPFAVSLRFRNFTLFSLVCRYVHMYVCAYFMHIDFEILRHIIESDASNIVHFV